MNTEETRLAPVGEHVCLYLTFESENLITLLALVFLVFVFILMSG